jgi:DNA (cytosine-5)-methyltransferase 1
MTFGSLFTGIGGMDLGLERAGMTCKWQVEIDPFCRKVLAKHWPNVPKYGDIRELTGSELERVDCIAGGFPCQDISSAGARGGIAEGTRSGLWVEMLRIVRFLQPRILLVENVSALLDRMDKGRRPAPIQRVLGDLAEIRFDAEWDCFPTGLNSGHRRDRVFIVAYPVREGLQGNGERRAAAHKARCLYVDAATPSFLRASPAPAFMRNLHGIPRRMDRIRSLGNGVYPAAGEWIGRRIIEATA